jgi:hypothetical protein
LTNARKGDGILMRKLLSACAVLAVAVGLVVAPGAGAVKSPKSVYGSVSLNVTPNPLPNATSTVTATGNVASNSNCRKDRDITFAWVNGATITPATGSAETRSNGDYTATVSRPTETAPGTTSIVLRATAAQEKRKVGSKKKGKKKKKGRKFICEQISGDSTVTLIP